MAEPYTPFGYMPPTLGPQRRRIPMPADMGFMPPQLPTAEGGAMPQSGAEAADLAQGGQWAGGMATMAAPFALAGPVGGALGMAGRAAMAAPRATAALAGGAALATPASTQQPAGRTATQRQDRIKELNAEIAKREKTLEGFATRNFQSKTAREAASKPHLDAIEAARNELTSIRTGADAEIAAAAQAAADKTWRESGVTQRYPWLVPAMGAAGFGLGSALSRSIASRGVQRYNQNVGELEGRWRGAVDAARGARTQGGRDAGITQAEGFRDQFRDMTQGAPFNIRSPSTWMGHGGPQTRGSVVAPAVGTEIGVGIPTILDEWQAYSTPPGSPARQHSHEFWSDPANLAGRFLPGALLGTASGKALTMAAKRNVNAPLGYQAETSALRQLAPLGGGGRGLAGSGPQQAPGATLPGHPPTTPPPAAPPPATPGLATLGTVRPAQPLESSPPPAPRGTRQAEGPPEGATWNPTTQRWHHRGRMIGGASRWPPPTNRTRQDYLE